MKNLKSFSLVLILPLLLLSLFACQGGSSLVSPDNTSVSSEDPNWISLPASDNNQLRKTVSVTQLITAQNSGKISLRDFYKGGPHKKVSISAEIKFEPNSIDEDTYFTMSADDNTGMISFSPSMVFHKDATLTFTITGMDLGDLEENDVNFVYFDANGQLVALDFKKLKISLEKGELGILQAKIPHFSRYGFTK